MCERERKIVKIKVIQENWVRFLEENEVKKIPRNFENGLTKLVREKVAKKITCKYNCLEGYSHQK